MGGEPYRLHEGGDTLRAQVNARWPNRDTASDGWIGDSAHQGRPSDHNPDNRGWVHALDIDKDGIDADALADQLIALARRGEDRGRLKNVVFRGRVASGTFSNRYWVWRSDPDLGHYHHIHVSFTDGTERDGSPWPLPIFAPKPPPEPEPTPAPEVPTMIVLRNGLSKYRLVTGDRIVGISEEFAKALVAAGVPQSTVPTADLENLQAALVSEA
jgi:hypothetical protein